MESSRGGLGPKFKVVKYLNVKRYKKIRYACKFGDTKEREISLALLKLKKK